MDVSGGFIRSLRQPLWRNAFIGAVFSVIAPLVMLSEASGIEDPHDTAKPKYCLNCHTEEIYTKICNETEGYCLLGGSVDGICLICHIKEDCCKPGLEHLPKLHLGLRGHPSDVEIRAIPRDHYPKTLPIHHGRITCNTCHLHTREATGGYKMLRLVKITSQGVDWSVLCKDCHGDR
jgi:hypothetical protein